MVEKHIAVILTAGGSARHITSPTVSGTPSHVVVSRRLAESSISFTWRIDMRNRWRFLGLWPFSGFQLLALSFSLIMVVSTVVTLFIGRSDVEKYKHKLASWKTEVVDQLGRKTIYEYDAAGRRFSETDPLGRTQSYQYDFNGNRVSHTAPDGTVTYQYDTLNRLSSTTNPDSVSDSLHKALHNISVHGWLLLGVERARLAKAWEKHSISSREYQKQLDELRAKEGTLLGEYPDVAFSLEDYVTRGTEPQTGQPLPVSSAALTSNFVPRRRNLWVTWRASASRLAEELAKHLAGSVEGKRDMNPSGA